MLSELQRNFYAIKIQLKLLASINFYTDAQVLFEIVISFSTKQLQLW